MVGRTIGAMRDADCDATEDCFRLRETVEAPRRALVNRLAHRCIDRGWWYERMDYGSRCGPRCPHMISPIG